LLSRGASSLTKRHHNNNSLSTHSDSIFGGASVNINISNIVGGDRKYSPRINQQMTPFPPKRLIMMPPNNCGFPAAIRITTSQLR